MIAYQKLIQVIHSSFSSKNTNVRTFGAHISNMFAVCDNFSLLHSHCDISNGVLEQSDKQHGQVTLSC